ncbi:MAG TPA: LLM class F420-dependent oxidoreductase [Thermomicrobiales bacterium]|nr:LLM class F420-dependent oxidoreductase [Thermomicrobiales bacterium]
MIDNLRQRIGPFGVWHGGTPPADLAPAIERLGYGAFWVGGSPSGDLQVVEDLIAATTSLIVATGIVNIWKSDADEVARSFARIQTRYPDRFVLGIGVGHPEATQEYRSPYASLEGYVDTLLAAGVPAGSLVLAALGPRVLRLAAERTAGAHPYLVPSAHSRVAREVMGPAALLAPEHKVVLDQDPDHARSLARKTVSRYLGLTNYTDNLRRMGFGDDDLTGSGSDALIDALVAHGSTEQVVGQLRKHLSAGADHVAIQLLRHDDEDPIESFTALAQALRLP